jgi:hypothetical protein
MVGSGGVHDGSGEDSRCREDSLIDLALRVAAAPSNRQRRRVGRRIGVASEGVGDGSGRVSRA